MANERCLVCGGKEYPNRTCERCGVKGATSPETYADNIMWRCWWDGEKTTDRPNFAGLDVEITKAIRDAIACERERCAKLVEGVFAEMRLWENMKEGGKLLADAIREGS